MASSKESAFGSSATFFDMFSGMEVYVEENYAIQKEEKGTLIYKKSAKDSFAVPRVVDGGQTQVDYVQ